MSESTAEDSTGGTCGVEGGRVELDLARLAGRGNHEAARSGGRCRGGGGGGGGGVEDAVER